MASGFGDLSGTGPQQVWINCHYVSYNQAGNYSTWFWEVRYYGNGYGSWRADADNQWSLSGFATTSGVFAIPYAERFNTYKVLGSGYFNKGHNSEGYLTVSNISAGISSPHASIGSGSATVYPGDAPRIPKVPGKPSNPVFQSAESDSLTFKITAPDARGSTITTYEMQVLPASSSTPVATWTGTSSIQVSPATLDPATDYRVRYRAKNGVGWGPYSNLVTMSTESGVFVSNGSAWIGVGPRVSNGSAWVNEDVKISDGAAWKDPINV